LEGRKKKRGGSFKRSTPFLEKSLDWHLKGYKGEEIGNSSTKGVQNKARGMKKRKG